MKKKGILIVIIAFLLLLVFWIILNVKQTQTSATENQAEISAATATEAAGREDEPFPTEKIRSSGSLVVSDPKDMEYIVPEVGITADSADQTKIDEDETTEKEKTFGRLEFAP